MFESHQDHNLFDRSLSWAVKSRRWVAFLFYLALLTDNILLTLVVPILPSYLKQLEDLSRPIPSLIISRTNSTSYGKIDHDEDEMSKIGALLASKAFIQLICNPLVSLFIYRWGYAVPQLFGVVSLFISSTLYSIGVTYWHFLVSRCVHGIASAFITVSGISTIAEIYTDEEQRSKVMGFTLGGIALGVLIGYPFGGLALVDDFIGRTTPFIILSVITVFIIFFQFMTFYGTFGQRGNQERTHIIDLITDFKMLIAIGAITISTSSMSILESCLPIWLIDNFKPPKWQLGTVFIPDSVGYLIGTNLFAGIAFKYGRWLTSLLSLSLVGICSIIIPFANAMSHLILPHFGLGLGIGITDAAILPLLAHLVDTRHGTASYGSIYALSQTAVCLAYSLGPLIGGQLAEHLGFSALFRIIGFANILYCPMCLALKSGVDDRMMIVGRKMLDNEMEEKKLNVNELTNYSSTQEYTRRYLKLKEDEDID